MTHDELVAALEAHEDCCHKGSPRGLSEVVCMIPVDAAAEVAAPLLDEIDALRAALTYYAEQRNYNPIQGDDWNDVRGSAPIYVSDGWDREDGLPGARARRALSETGEPS